MRFPTIDAVAHALRKLNTGVEGACHVRLTVYEDGTWTVVLALVGDDVDETGGYSGVGTVPGLSKYGKPSRFRADDLAKSLIEQARDAWALGRYSVDDGSLIE